MLRPDPTLFDAAFDRFRDLVLDASGEPFVSFDRGLPADWEAYKPRIRRHALDVLDLSGTEPDDIGTGEFLSRAIDAIEIDGDDQNRNNLVKWHGAFGGNDSRSHVPLIKAKNNPTQRRILEQLLFDLYQDQADPGHMFQALTDQGLRRYDLMAYLFFLKDSDRFMPIATRTFDAAFRELGIDLTMTQKCGWQNYLAYNQALQGVQQALQSRAGLSGIHLIDAHSFCWMLIRVDPAEVRKDRRKQQDKRAKLAALDPEAARRAMIRMMVNNAYSAAGDGGVRMGRRRQKKKTASIPRAEFEEWVAHLVTEQQGRCKLTDLPFRYDVNDAHGRLLPSLDRIDSNAGYEKNNLQVVCRFINYWKSDTDNETFKKLLSLVRESRD